MYNQSSFINKGKQGNASQLKGSKEKELSYLFAYYSK